MSFYKEVPGRKTTLESTLKFDTTPTAGSTNPVTSEGVRTSIKENTKNILDDGFSADVDIEIKTDAEGAALYDVGHYFEDGGQVFICTSITNDGDVYTVEGDKQNGLVPVINSLVDRIAALENA